MAFIAFPAKSQNKKVELSLTPNVSLQDPASITTPGIGLGGQFSYMFGKRLGIALQGASLTNNQDVDISLPKFDFETMGTEATNEWKMKYLTFGPLLRFGNKIHFDFSPQIGLGKISSPFSEVYTTIGGSGTKELLLTQGRNEEGSFDIIHNLGFKVGYQLNERLAFNFNANLLGNTLGVKSEFYTTKRDFTDFNEDGIISKDEVRDSKFIRETTESYSPLSIGGGITYSFGGKKKDKKKKNQTRSKRKNKEERNSYNKSSCSVKIISDSLQCADPFYDANSQEYIYKGYITVSASGARDMVMARPSSGPGYDYRNIFQSNVGSITVDGLLSNSGNCQVLSNWKQVLNGNSITYCVTYRTPVNGGTFNPWTMAYDQQYGAQNANKPGSCSAVSDPYAVQLPNCVCTNCDKVALQVDDANFRLGNQILDYNGTKYGDATFYPTIKAQTRIKSITAEIIHYKHRAEKAECYTCNKESFMNGQFFNQKPGTGGNRVLGNQYTSKQGTLTVSDKNYGNQITWTASNSSTGVDISNGQRLRLVIAFPAMPKLACCNDSIEVCIRYRITDINCNTCEVVKCYSDTRSYGEGTGPIKPGVLKPATVKPGVITKPKLVKPGGNGG